MKIFIYVCFAICIALMLCIVIAYRQRKHPSAAHDITQGEKPVDMEVVGIKTQIIKKKDSSNSQS